MTYVHWILSTEPSHRRFVHRTFDLTRRIASRACHSCTVMPSSAHFYHVFLLSVLLRSLSLIGRQTTELRVTIYGLGSSFGSLEETPFSRWLCSLFAWLILILSKANNGTWVGKAFTSFIRHRYAFVPRLLQ